ncbi:MAG: 50S ribosomal protein L11 methyltransferase [Acidobacteriota bacterium]
MADQLAKIYKRIEVTCPARSADIVTMACHEMGTLGIEENVAPKRRVRIVAYFDRGTNVAQLKKKIERITPGYTQIEFAILEEPRGLDTWLEEFNRRQVPVEIGSRFLVSPVESVRSEARIVLVVPAERAFGTGTHVTTRQCMEAIETLVRPGHTVLDLGTGTGILAMAAARLGASRVDAVDRDQEAVEIARGNVARNELGRTVRVIHGDITAAPHPPYDLIAANLLADAIVGLVPDMVAILRRSGSLVLSGILKGPQATRVVRSLQQNGIWQISRVREGEWVTLVGDRRNPSATRSPRDIPRDPNH